NSSLYLIGNVNIGLNTLTLEGDGNFALLGGISNSRFVTLRNSVRKAGAGVLTVLQPSDHNVPTIVNGGTLAAESRMTNSDVTINTGASLRGSGSIGGLTVNSGGVVQPGGINPGALQCFGDVSLASGSTLRLRLNGTSAGMNYDQLQVKGAVMLGGTLDIILGFLPAVGDQFTLIRNDGTNGIAGTFDGLPQNAVLTINGRNYRI